MHSTKKLINEPRNCVDESLSGFAASHAEVKKLKDARVLVRSDLVEFRSSNKVAIVCGGGSGHEPMFAGFIGRGGLTAAIAGSVFTSPPPAQILTCLKAVENKTGILVLIINYTGDRLNFGIAIERFRLSSTVPLKYMMIADDCALKSHDRSAGRRGLAATSFVIKMAGSMAETGKYSLDEMHLKLTEIADNIGTVGLSLSSCSLPGKGPMFQLGADQMELGLGIHGEPGVRRMQLQPAKAAVDTMLSHMLDPTSPSRIDLPPKTEIAVIVNNLGGLSQLEMNIVSLEVVGFFHACNMSMRRIYVGTFMTSLEMQGVSVSVLKLRDDWLEHLDTSVCFSSWPRFDRRLLDVTRDFWETEAPGAEPTQIRASSLCRADSHVAKCLRSVCECLMAHEEHLNELDRCCGDGDCGSTIRRGASAVLDSLTKGLVGTESASQLLADLSLVVESSAGGTAGAIYSLLLSTASRTLRAQPDAEWRADSWIKALRCATDAVMLYGSARRGDRTMVDPLAAACDFADSERERGIDKQFCRRLQEVVDETAKSTKDMKARAGRASYVAEANLTQPDPGAVGVSVWMKALIDYVIANGLMH